MKKNGSLSLALFGHEFKGFKFFPNRRANLGRRNDKIARDWRQGYSTEQLAKKYLLTENRIFQILADKGVRRPKWQKMKSHKRSLIFRLQRKGLSKAEIGRQVGVSRERVRQIIKEGK